MGFPGYDPPTAAKTATGHSQGTSTLTVESKIFTFDELHVGDGQQDGGKIVFQSDGLGSFICNTLTYHTHNGDIWRSVFKAFDARGKQLFETADFEGPRMSDGNPPPKYPWSVQFLFPKETYSAIASVTQGYLC